MADTFDLMLASAFLSRSGIILLRNLLIAQGRINPLSYTFLSTLVYPYGRKAWPSYFSVSSICLQAAKKWNSVSSFTTKISRPGLKFSDFGKYLLNED